MKLTSSQIKKYNKIADAGKKPIMVRVGSKWYTWYEGDPKYGVFLTTQSGKDVEFDFKQIDDIQENKMEKMKSKLREIIREELLKEGSGDTKISTKSEMKKALMSAFTNLSKGKMPLGIYRGDTGEYLTAESGISTTNQKVYEIWADNIKDALRELK